MTITVPPSGLIDIVEFSNLLDISKCVYYTLKQNKDGTLSLTFYDKNNKRIKLYGTKKETKKNAKKSNKKS